MANRCGFCGGAKQYGADHKCWRDSQRGKREQREKDRRLERRLAANGLLKECHILYRFFDSAGHLLYVGITNNPLSRLMAHSKRAAWIADAALATMEHFPDRASLERAERKAIREECPRHNAVYSPGKELPPRLLPSNHRAARPNTGLVDRQQVLDLEIREFDRDKDTV